MKFQCPFCQAINEVDFEDCGTNVACATCSSVVTVPASRVSTGAVIADFIILQELGRGGMGVVYLAHQISLDRTVALKILSEHYARNSEFIVGFYKEARAAAKLNHPHIVQAYAVGEDEGVFYFAMENIDGDTLKTILKDRQRVSVSDALLIMQQISEALAYAWQEAKIIHCDIKPDNIMLTKGGRAKLADLGLARVAGDFDSDSDEVMGTPQYISPEQLTGAPLDGRTDIYSLGATFFHAITGRFAFEGKTATEIARKHLQEPVVSPKEIAPEIPDDVCRIILKMMAKNPGDRYQTADALVEDLREARRSKTGKSKTRDISLKGKRMLAQTKIATTSTAPVNVTSSTGIDMVKVSTATRGLPTDSDLLRGPEGTQATTTALAKKQREDSKSQKIILLIIGLIAIGAVASAIIWILTGRGGGETAEKPRLPTRLTSTTTAQQSPLKQQTPINKEDFTKTPLLIGIEEVLASAARRDPKTKPETLSKCRDLFARFPAPRFNFELKPWDDFMRVFGPLDEELSATKLREAKRGEHVAAIQAAKTKYALEEERKEKAEKSAWDQAFATNTIDAYKKYLDRYPDGKYVSQVESQIKKLQDEEAARQQRLDDYAKELEDRRDFIRRSFPRYVHKKDFAAARKKFDSAIAEAKREDLAPEYQEKAKAFSKWAATLQESITKSEKFWNAFSNCGADLRGVRIEIKDRDPDNPKKVKDRYYGAVYKIEKGKLFLNYPLGTNDLMEFPLESLRHRSLRKDDFDYLAEKFLDAHAETRKNNGLFHFYLIEGDSQRAKKWRPDDDFDWPKEAKEIQKALKEKE